jgi:CBS domain-containing membrane protein
MSARQNFSGLAVGRCYSNGVFGRNWQVRQIVSLEGEAVVYKVLAGPNRRRRVTCTLAEFTAWIGYEVQRDENSWVRAQ